MIFVIIVTWLRFLTFFRLFHRLSSLFVTLIKMVEETMKFAFLMFAYIGVVATVFHGLFKDYN